MDEEIVLPGVAEAEKKEAEAIEQPKGFVPVPDQTIGSAYIRIGRSSDFTPQTFAHVLACRSSTTLPPTQPDPYFSAAANAAREPILQIVEAAEVQPLRGDTKPQKRRRESATPAAVPQDIDVVHESEEPDPYQYTDVSAKPAFVFAEKALRIRKGEPYRVLYPFFRGGLNVSPTYPLQEVLSHIAKLWRYLFFEKLGINGEKDLENYAVLVVVPDMFDRRDLREIAHLMTREFRCKAFTFFQESVAGAFAAGSSTACVVDIGDQKVSISCVEEGVSLPHTRIQMNYGGRDVTRFLLWLLLRNGFPHKSCSMDDTRDLLVLTALKETLCHLRPALTTDFFDFTALKEGTTNRAKRYRISLTDCLLLANASLFTPALLQPLQPPVTSWPTPYDTEDIFDDDLITRLLGPPKPKSDVSEGVVVEPTQLNNNSITLHAHHRRLLLPLDEAVCASIEKISRRDVVKKLYSNIVIAGGGSLIPGLTRALEDRVFNRATTLSPDVERVEVLANRKDLDARVLSWKGGAVVASITREFWITLGDWEVAGVRAMRDRLPFVF